MRVFAPLGSLLTAKWEAPKRTKTSDGLIESVVECLRVGPNSTAITHSPPRHTLKKYAIEAPRIHTICQKNGHR